MTPRTASASPAEPSFPELFTPKLVTVIRGGYGWPDLRADAVSGLTVAVVALPLSMAIAIASGVSPERGLYTAIAGGLIVSLIAGSRFQIGGPAGAFIGLVAGVVERHGYANRLSKNSADPHPLRAAHCRAPWAPRQAICASRPTNRKRAETSLEGGICDGPAPPRSALPPGPAREHARPSAQRRPACARK